VTLVKFLSNSGIPSISKRFQSCLETAGLQPEGYWFHLHNLHDSGHTDEFPKARYVLWILYLDDLEGATMLAPAIRDTEKKGYHSPK
jgi:hypothetical protein